MIAWDTTELATRQRLDADASELLPLYRAELLRASISFRHAAERESVIDAVRLCNRMISAARLYGYCKLADSLDRALLQIAKGEEEPAAFVASLEAVTGAITSH